MRTFFIEGPFAGEIHDIPCARGANAFHYVHEDKLPYIDADPYREVPVGVTYYLSELTPNLLLATEKPVGVMTTEEARQLMGDIAVMCAKFKAQLHSAQA